MKESTRASRYIILTSVTIGAVASIAARQLHHVYQEIRRRGYPSWEECNCDFKTQETIFQVWHGHIEQRGETIVAQERGLYLVHPPQWLRHFLHHSAQIITVLNPGRHYIERITLSPQQSYQFASILHANTTNEDLPEPTFAEEAYVTWRREVLHFPRSFLDKNLSRLYPVHVPLEKLPHVESLPALWDPVSNLPLPTEGTLLSTPVGTRIDCIGWSPTQITYCTARLKPAQA